MDRHSYNAYFVDLQIWRTPPYEELNEEDMSAREVSYKYKQWCKRNHPDKQKDDMEDENK